MPRTAGERQEANQNACAAVRHERGIVTRLKETSKVFLNRGIRCSAALAVLVCAVFVPAAYAKPWYETATFSCGDPLTVRPGTLGAGWFAKPIPFVFPTAGKLYITMTLADFRAGSTSVGAPFDAVTLSSSQAASLRGVLAMSAASAETRATASSVASYLAGLVTHLATSTVIDQLLSYLSRDATTSAVTARIVSETVASGGVLTRALTPARDAKGHEYLYDTISYQVSVGSETRSYVLTSCFFPVKIAYVRFKTVSPLNNKIFTQLANGRWRSFDVDSAKFEGNEWEEVDRDDEYMYFHEVGFADTWRISMRGGTWQHQHADGTWGTLYAQVVAE